MQWIRAFMIPIAAGLAAAIVLGQAAALEPRIQELRQAVTANAPHRQLALSDDNLADAVSGLRLAHRVTRVAWEPYILTIDMAVRGPQRSVQPLWQDMTALLRFSFGETANVRQTLVRIYRETSDGRTLLFYGDPRRDAWPKTRLDALRLPETGAGGAIPKQIGLSATPEGDRWLRNLAN